MLWNLIIVGANTAGLSVAYEAQRAGLDRVLVLEPGEQAVPAGAPGRHGLLVQFQTDVARLEERDEETVIVESATESFLCRACVDARPLEAPSPPPDYPIPEALRDRVHLSLPLVDLRDLDVLVVGDGERAVADAARLEARGARVVLAFCGDFDHLARLSRRTLGELEHDRRVTVLWRSVPSAIEPLGGHPMAFFDDRRTPDLQFDHVVYAFRPVAVEEEPARRIYRLHAGGLPPGHAWSVLAERHREDFPPLRPAVDTRRVTGAQEIQELRREHYNATITHFDHSHEDLWVIRVRPDTHDVSHVAGQYATLGLGYWEPRVDDVDEKLTPQRRRRLIRRSYSLSSRIFDELGYLVDQARLDEIELYIVHVRPEGDRIPRLTPRLADKRAGDRVYLGPKVAGRYTLDPVTDPHGDVVFLATGTGEAPHNSMIVELLRKGHAGGVVSVVTVRYLRDLGYLEAHRRLEERFPNYRYVVLPTREPDVEKRYVQDLITSGDLEKLLPRELDPEATHVFLCGNPAMIGLPDWKQPQPAFPERLGVAQLLNDRGYRLDRRGDVGNVHYEEYW